MPSLSLPTAPAASTSIAGANPTPNSAQHPGALHTSADPHTAVDAGFDTHIAEAQAALERQPSAPPETAASPAPLETASRESVEAQLAQVEALLAHLETPAPADAINEAANDAQLTALLVGELTQLHARAALPAHASTAPSLGVLPASAGAVAAPSTGEAARVARTSVSGAEALAVNATGGAAQLSADAQLNAETAFTPQEKPNAQATLERNRLPSFDGQRELAVHAKAQLAQEFTATAAARDSANSPMMNARALIDAMGSGLNNAASATGTPAALTAAGLGGANAPLSLISGASEAANALREALPSSGAEQLARSAESARLGAQITQQLRQQLITQINQQQQQTTIRLDPPELGALEIFLQHDNGRLQISISAAHADVARALQQSSERLRQELTHQAMVEVNVDIAHDQSRGQTAGQSRPEVDDQVRLSSESATPLATPLTQREPRRPAHHDSHLLVTV